MWTSISHGRLVTIGNWNVFFSSRSIRQSSQCFLLLLHRWMHAPAYWQTNYMYIRSIIRSIIIHFLKWHEWFVAPFRRRSSLWCPADEWPMHERNDDEMHYKKPLAKRKASLIIQIKSGIGFSIYSNALLRSLFPVHLPSPPPAPNRKCISDKS